MSMIVRVNVVLIRTVVVVVVVVVVFVVVCDCRSICHIFISMLLGYDNFAKNFIVITVKH